MAIVLNSVMLFDNHETSSHGCSSRSTCVFMKLHPKKALVIKVIISSSINKGVSQTQSMQREWNQTDSLYSIQFRFSITLFPASPHDGWDGEKKIGYRVVKDILLYYIVLQDKDNEVSHRKAEWGSLSYCAMWSRMCNQRRWERWHSGDRVPLHFLRNTSSPYFVQEPPNLHRRLFSLFLEKVQTL